MCQICETAPALTWESTGTEEPRDQTAVSPSMPGARWEIGPDLDEFFTITFIDTDGNETGYAPEPTEVEAKQAAAALDAFTARALTRTAATVRPERAG